MRFGASTSIGACVDASLATASPPLPSETNSEAVAGERQSVPDGEVGCAASLRHERDPERRIVAKHGKAVKCDGGGRDSKVATRMTERLILTKIS